MLKLLNFIRDKLKIVNIEQCEALYLWDSLSVLSWLASIKNWSRSDLLTLPKVLSCSFLTWIKCVTRRWKYWTGLSSTTLKLRNLATSGNTYPKMLVIPRSGSKNFREFTTISWSGVFRESKGSPKLHEQMTSLTNALINILMSKLPLNK